MEEETLLNALEQRLAALELQLGRSAVQPKVRGSQSWEIRERE